MKTRILLASMVIVCLAAGGANSVQGAGIQDGLFEFDGTSPYWQFEGDVTRIDAGDATYLWMEEARSGRVTYEDRRFGCRCT
jgi:predicted small secreted protein